MYTDRNFKTKKQLKEALAQGIEVTVFQPNDMFNKDYSTYTGTVTLEGPHYPEPHKWYAQGEVVNGKLVSVK